MHVLMLIWNYWPGPEGGAERQCRRQAQALVARGLSCTVLTHRTRFCAPRHECDAGVEIRRFGLIGPIVHGVYTRWPRRHRAVPPMASGAPGASPTRPSLAWRAFRWLRRLDYFLFIAAASRFYRRNASRFEVVHVHGACWMPGWARWLVGDRPVPVISKETITPVLKPFDADVPWRGRWEALRRGAFFIAIHGQMAEELQAAGIPADRLRVIPNGVPIPAQPAPVAENRAVLFIGNFTQGVHHKAFDILLDGWKFVAAAEDRCTLHILGRGDATPWQDRVARDGLGARVRFHGFVEDPTPFFEKAAVFALPSRLEGVSNALLEAQSWGIPAVVSDIPGNRAVVQDGVTGIVCPVGDAGSFGAGLLELLRHPARRASMGRAAREHVRERFGMAGVAAELEGLYTQLLARTSAPTSR